MSELKPDLDIKPMGGKDNPDGWSKVGGIDRILEDAKQDRELFKEAISKIDQRMYLLEEQLKDVKDELRRR